MGTRRGSGAALLALLAVQVVGAVRSYDVEPVKGDWSGWTTYQHDTVRQVVTVNFDLPVKAARGYPGHFPYS